MTKNIKRTITLILTIAMFAIMSNTAFATNKNTTVSVLSVSNLIGRSLFESEENGGVGFIAPINNEYNDESVHTFARGKQTNFNGVFNYVTVSGDTLNASTFMTGIIPSTYREYANNPRILKAMNAIPTSTNLFATPIVKFSDKFTNFKSEMNRDITREEFAIILANAYKYGGFTGNPDVTTTIFTDADEFLTTDGKAAAQFCIDNGLMNYEGHYEKFIDHAALTPEMIALVTDGTGRVFLDYYEQERWVENTDGKFNPQNAITGIEVENACAKLRKTLREMSKSSEIITRENNIKINRAIFPTNENIISPYYYVNE